MRRPRDADAPEPTLALCRCETSNLLRPDFDTSASALIHRQHGHPNHSQPTRSSVAMAKRLDVPPSRGCVPRT
jgi:hypothetical protein